MSVPNSYTDDHMKPEQLFRYADRYARRHEKAGMGTQYPTVRRAAKRFRVPQSVIVEAVEGAYIEGVYFGLVTAVGISGVGHADLDGGDQQVEAYHDIPSATNGAPR